MKKPFLSVAALFIVLAGLGSQADQAGAPQQAQPAAQQPPTFQLEVEYVEVDAIVTNERGEFVRDLRKEDFVVLEDGKPQTTAVFALIDVPIERYEPRAAGQPIEPDVKTNERPFDGRVYVMLIDDYHTAPLRSGRLKAAARQFIEQHFGPNDLMAVVHTFAPRDANQEFTNNKRLLMAAVDRTIGDKLPSATITRTDQYYRNKEMGIDENPNDPEARQRASNARSSMRTLRAIADWFGSIRGRRKAILFVSEGIDYDIRDVINDINAQGVLDETRDAISAAMRANVSIYGIDPRGMTGSADEDITVTDFPDNNRYGVGRKLFETELQLSQDSLRTISDETGGFATVNLNNLSTSFERIVADQSSYYVLAYAPTIKPDGRFHRVEVRVNRPGLTVRARRGYIFPRERRQSASIETGKGPSPALRDAVNNLLPVSGLTIRAFAAPFKGKGSNTSVLLSVEAPGRNLRLAANDKLEWSYYAIDAQDNVRGTNTGTVTMNFRPESKPRVEQTGIRVINRLDLPPGRYQLRLAVRDTGSGAVGGIRYDLDVPDFTKGPLQMSGLVLTSASGSAWSTPQVDEALSRTMPGPPISLRTFPQDDEIAFHVEIYDNQLSSPHTVDIVTTITSADGREVLKSEDTRTSAELRAGPGFGGRLSLNNLAPGSYVLAVEARSRLGKGATATRQTQFTVQ